jgi:GxxExxY protein
MPEIIYKEESYKIMGACMKVHRTLGAGFLEAVYEEALEMEFKSQGIPYKKQVLLELHYEGIQLKKKYRADFICYDSIILEIKSVSIMPNAFYDQLKNYLKCTQLPLGILINFCAQSLVYKIIIKNNIKLLNL